MSQRPSRWRLAIVVALAAAIAVLAYLVARPPTLPTRRAPTPRSAAGPVPLATGSVSPRRPELEVLPEGNAAITRGPVDQAEFYLRTAADYRRRARYPKQSEPLFGGQTDPIRNDLHRVRRDKGGNDERGPRLLLEGPESVVVYPDPVQVTATLTDPVSREPLAAHIVAHLRKGPPHPIDELIPVSFVDDGSAGDTAGDRTYTWRWQPATRAEADKLSGLQNVYLDVTWGAGGPDERITAGIGWEYSAPAGARLTGRFRDRIDDGDLLIEAEVDVVEPGRFHLQMSLYGPDDQPIAWAQNERVAQLDAAGRSWIPVRVYGLLLRDSTIDGPYVGKLVWLRDVSTMPPRNTGALTDAFRTQPYRATDFRADPFDDPIDLDKADQLEQTGGEILDEADERGEGPR